MKLLDQLALEETQNIAAESDLDEATKLAHAAELRALRNLQRVAQQKRWALTRTLERLPGVADVAAWKRLVAASRAAVTENGTRDLVTIAREKP